MLCCVHAEPAEAEGDEIRHVGRDSLLDVVALSVEVGQACEPPCVQVEGIGPAVQDALAVEVQRSVSGGWELLKGGKPGLLALSVGVVLRVHGRSGGALLGAESLAVGVRVAVVRVRVVSAPSHVVHDGVGVDPNSEGAAGVDHGTKLIAGAHAALELVADGLIHEVPRIHDVLEGLGAHDLLLRRKDLDAHVASVGEELALLLHVLVRPAEELDNGSLLTRAVVALGVSQLDVGGVPDKVKGLKVNGGLVGAGDSQGDGPLGVGGSEGCGGLGLRDAIEGVRESRVGLVHGVHGNGGGLHSLVVGDLCNGGFAFIWVFC